MTEHNPNNMPDGQRDEQQSSVFVEKQVVPPQRRWLKPAVAIVVIGVLAYFVWQWINQTSGVQRNAPEVTTIIPLPPPPPPPPEPEKVPEPEEPPPEPEMVEPDPVPEEPTPVEEPLPEEAPTPADSEADPMQMDSDGQAGSDAFNIGAGKGGGMAGAGGGRIGNATYGQYLGYALQKTLREAEATRNLVYRMNINLWIDREGRVTRVEIVRPSDDTETDQKVLAVLRSTIFEQRPTSSTTMPVKVAVNSRRPS